MTRFSTRLKPPAASKSLRRTIGAFAGGLVLIASSAEADKVIMKSGKIYEGRIMGETTRSVLISNAPFDPTPHFLPYQDILTIVRDTPVLEPAIDLQRVLMAEFALTGQVFSPNVLTLHPAAGLHMGGGLRPHPLIEIDAGIDWLPEISGHLGITDGTITRGYDHFDAYGGGFALRAYPFYRHKNWRWEPYATAGYQWNRLVMKDSGDYLKGRTWQGGLGVLHPWKWHLYWDLRFLYQRTTYDDVEFLLREGGLSPTIHNPICTFSTGLSYRY